MSRSVETCSKRIAGGVIRPRLAGCEKKAKTSSIGRSMVWLASRRWVVMRSLMERARPPKRAGARAGDGPVLRQQHRVDDVDDPVGGRDVDRCDAGVEQ